MDKLKKYKKKLSNTVTACNNEKLKLEGIRDKIKAENDGLVLVKKKKVLKAFNH